MKEVAIKQIMAGGGGWRGAMVRPWLWLASRSYGDILAWRRWNYRRAVYKSYRFDSPVVCVGNITTGGTGKTPMVAWVSRRLQQMHRTPAIVTRGYKARGGKSDEAEMLRCLCDCAIVVNADRVAGARTAIVAGADVVILDDGFQHRRLRRDLDIVLIDALNPFGYGYVLPRGLLRERLGALREAHAIVITRSDLTFRRDLVRLRERLTKLAPQASIHLAVHRPTKLLDENDTEQRVAALKGKAVLAFCGLGNPDGFFATLAQLQPKVMSHVAFDDHTVYDGRIVEQLDRQAQAAGAEVLVTTQKDGVKLAGLTFQRPVWQLAVEIELVEGCEELLAKLADVAGPPSASEQDQTAEADL